MMSTTRKAFKVAYELIADGVITEKEAYALMEGIFDKEVMQIPIPITQIETENPQEQPAKETDEVFVKGFGRE